MFKTSHDFIVIFALLCMFSCVSLKQNTKTLDSAIQKLSQNVNVSYDYVTKTDNYFNSTQSVDSGSVCRFRSEGGLFGFGFYVRQNKTEYLFDGTHFSKYKHDEKVKVVFDGKEIKTDSNYFDNFSFWAQSPFHLGHAKGLVKLADIFKEDKKQRVYFKEYKQPSMSDNSLTVTYQKYMFLDKTSNEVLSIKDITILENDTLQISEKLFRNYTFKSKCHPEIQRLENLNYAVVLAENEFPDPEITPIKIGQKVKNRTYLNIHENETFIYGEDGKSSLIIFGFIGCAPCERALKDLKFNYPPLRKDIDIFYSSFQNKNIAIQKYLNKKEIPFIAFGEESKMIMDFQLYHAPTFVFIDANGIVTDVQEGYDHDVKTKILDLIK